MVLSQTCKEILMEKQGSGGSFHLHRLAITTSKPRSWNVPSTWNLLIFTADLTVTVCFQCHLFPTGSGAGSLKGISMGEGKGVQCNCCWPASLSLSTVPPWAGQLAPCVHGMRSLVSTISHTELPGPGLCSHLV